MPGARRASRRRYVLLVIVLTCLTLITLDSRNGRSGVLGSLGGLAHRIVSPVQGAVDSVARPVGDWWDSVTNSGSLKKQNRALQQQIAVLKGQQTAAAEAIRENADLKRLLKLSNLLLVDHVSASIIGTTSGSGNFDPVLTIDKGSESGIAVSMPVIAPEGIVGQITEVWNGGANVQVFSDPEFAVGVQTPGHPGGPATTGIASGSAGTHNLTVEFAAGTKVRIGDPIVTSAQSTLFPAGLPVGTITSVTIQPGNTGVNATIKPYVNISELQHVTVLLWTPGTPGPVLPPPSTTTTATTTTTLPGSSTTGTGSSSSTSTTTTTHP